MLHRPTTALGMPLRRCSPPGNGQKYLSTGAAYTDSTTATSKLWASPPRMYVYTAMAGLCSAKTLRQNISTTCHRYLSIYTKAATASSARAIISSSTDRLISRGGTMPEKGHFRTSAIITPTEAITSLPQARGRLSRYPDRQQRRQVPLVTSPLLPTICCTSKICSIWQMAAGSSTARSSVCSVTATIFSSWYRIRRVLRQKCLWI